MLFRINLPFTPAITNTVIVINSYHNAMLKPVGHMVVACFLFCLFVCFYLHYSFALFTIYRKIGHRRCCQHSFALFPRIKNGTKVNKRKEGLGGRGEHSPRKH